MVICRTTSFDPFVDCKYVGSVCRVMGTPISVSNIQIVLLRVTTFVPTLNVESQYVAWYGQSYPGMRRPVRSPMKVERSE